MTKAKPQRPSTLVKFGSKLLLKVGYYGPQIREAENGQVLVGIFTDRLREYVTDWTFEQAESAIREYEQLECDYQESTRRT